MIIDRPWAIVYGPKSERGPGLAYGLGATRKDAWANTLLILYGSVPPNSDHAVSALKKQGMVARRVEVHLSEDWETLWRGEVK
jgi:hypothetical protein